MNKKVCSIILVLNVLHLKYLGMHELQLLRLLNFLEISLSQI